MKKIITYLKSIGISIGLILLINIVVTLLQYFNIFSKASSFFKIITLVISIFIGAYQIGKVALKKGYLEGLKFGIIIILLFLLINLLFFKDLQLKNIIYYLIILISSTTGSMLGIQKKSSNN